MNGVESCDNLFPVYTDIFEYIIGKKKQLAFPSVSFV